MNSKIRVSFLRPLSRTPARTAGFKASFSTSCPQRASNDPATDLHDIVQPAKTRRPEPTSPVCPRDPSLSSDGSNPMLSGYPSPDNPTKMTSSTATADTTTPQRGTPSGQRSATGVRRRATTTGAGARPGAKAGGDQFAGLLNMLGGGGNSTAQFQRSAGKGRLSAFRTDADQSDRGASTRTKTDYQIRQDNRKSAVATLGAMERLMSRTWRPGDVYAPHDLSPAEQMKARSARLGSNSRFRLLTRARSRRLGGADAFDVLRLDPVKEYKNYTMMGDFVTDMGRIRGARETGLRAVNQRKLAKAVRRSIGMGLIPSVHKHPELMSERVEQRSVAWKRNVNLPR